ncbi:uncharacterized protein LOC125823830 [Solanum verrucosum]|uniref:uncharacterized protein LOC125823830 n=1 Tax=Solanum verrucosum TaxID=315347 RepID=UPI0020D056CB|nr:uncharacterized protein LOC125823830 [Solanum verrucosum]
MGDNNTTYIVDLGENGDRDLVVVTRSGKLAVDDLKGNDEAQAHEEDKGIEEEETPIQQSPPIPKMVKPLPKITPPFPQCLKKKNEDKNFKKCLLVFKTLLIILPLVKALLEMSVYAKFMKELVTMKRSLDFETIEVSHSFSVITTNEMIKTRRIPEPSLCDLGASINLMSNAIYKQLGLGEPKSTTMRLLMADRSIKHPMGII